MSTCQILLSTYNGQKFITDFLDSLVRQSFMDFSILVRDDGSSDETVSIIQGYKRKLKIEILSANRNLGSGKSFFELLKNSSNNARCFMFADQDDVWAPDKTQKAYQTVLNHNEKEALLYFCRCELVDEHLNHIGYSVKPRVLDFQSALVQNSSPGCTMAFNAQAKRLLLQHELPEGLMHDRWCFLLVKTFGFVHYDPESLIKYRQHSANVIGTTRSIRQRTKRFIKNLRLGKRSIGIQEYAYHLQRLHQNRLSDLQKKQIRKILHLRKSMLNRVLFAFAREFRRQTFWDTLILKARVIFNWF